MESLGEGVVLRVQDQLVGVASRSDTCCEQWNSQRNRSRCGKEKG